MLSNCQKQGVADLHTGKYKSVIEAFVHRNEALLHHDQIQIALTIENLLEGHFPAAVLGGIFLRHAFRSHAQRVLLGNVLKSFCHRIGFVGRIAGVDHDVGDMENIGCHCAGNTGKIVHNGISRIIPQHFQSAINIGTCFHHEHEGRTGCTAAIVLFILFLLFIVLVIFSHPGIDGHKLCAGGLNDMAKAFHRKICDANTPVDKLGHHGQGGIHMAKRAQR